jgi:predicted lipoprotein with Yx(FWY)xxD motif
MAGATLALSGLSASAVILGADTAGAATNVTVSTAKTAKFGTVLVSGKTLYTLKANSTPCTADCIAIWPELVLPKGVKKAKAGKGVNASKLGTIKRTGGVLQVTYGGKPLYFFSGDTGSGQVNGNVTDTWGKWSDVVTTKAGGSSSSGGGGSTAGSGGASF